MRLIDSILSKNIQDLVIRSLRFSSSFLAPCSNLISYTLFNYFFTSDIFACLSYPHWANKCRHLGWSSLWQYLMACGRYCFQNELQFGCCRVSRIRCVLGLRNNIRIPLLSRFFLASWHYSSNPTQLFLLIELTKYLMFINLIGICNVPEYWILM